MAVLTIFAGANGSGKSSIIRKIEFAGRENLLEADAIAAHMHASDPQAAAIAAGREVLSQTQRYLDSGHDFAIETTLSGTWTTKAIRQALERLFIVRVVYVCLDTPERCIQRVHERVAQGGHSVPDQDVRRRYLRSLSNLKQILKIVNEALLYDNSGPEPRLVMEMRSGHRVWMTSDMPEWTRDLL